MEMHRPPARMLAIMYRGNEPEDGKQEIHLEWPNVQSCGLLCTYSQCAVPVAVHDVSTIQRYE